MADGVMSEKARRNGYDELHSMQTEDQTREPKKLIYAGLVTRRPHQMTEQRAWETGSSIEPLIGLPPFAKGGGLAPVVYWCHAWAIGRGRIVPGRGYPIICPPTNQGA